MKDTMPTDRNGPAMHEAGGELDISVWNQDIPSLVEKREEARTDELIPDDFICRFLFSLR